MLNPFRYPYIYALLLLLVLFTDQAGKLVAKQLSAPRPLLGSHLVYGYFTNTGIGFGLTVPYPVIIAAVGVAIAGVLVWLIQSFRHKQIFLIWGLSIVCVGALSNLIDRLIYRHVIDYFSLFGWPVFNFADLLIIGGVVLVLLSWLRPSAKKQPAEK